MAYTKGSYLPKVAFEKRKDQGPLWLMASGIHTSTGPKGVLSRCGYSAAAGPQVSQSTMPRSMHAEGWVRVSGTGSCQGECSSHGPSQRAASQMDVDCRAKSSSIENEFGAADVRGCVEAKTTRNTEASPCYERSTRGTI